MDEQRTDDPRPINRIYLIWLIIAGLIEGTSTLILFFVAMPMKYWMGMPEVVSIVGMIHGVLFVGLVAMFLIARFVVPISWWLVFLGFIGAIVPFGPFLVDLELAAILRRDDADRARR